MKGSNVNDDESDRTEGPLVSFVLATYNRKDDLAEAVQTVLDQEYPRIEIVIVSNSTDGTAKLFEDGSRFDRDDIKFLEFEGRMGPPKARNIGYRQAIGEIIVTFDDDATLPDSRSTDRIVEAFDTYPDVGVLAFQSRDYYTGEVVRREIPDPPIGDPADADEAYETTFFVGVGTAIRQSVVDKTGYYPENFVYGFEEMDLSLRVLDAGYDILYLPSVTVRHKKTAAGRTPDQNSLGNQLENRLRILVRNFPWHHVLLSAIIWSVYTAVRSGFKIEPVLDAVRNIIAERDNLLNERRVLEASTIAHLQGMGGMFFWLYGPDPRRFLEDGVGLERLRW